LRVVSPVQLPPLSFSLFGRILDCSRSFHHKLQS
jgi:hypothetical protein